MTRRAGWGSLSSTFSIFLKRSSVDWRHQPPSPTSHCKSVGWLTWWLLLCWCQLPAIEFYQHALCCCHILMTAPTLEHSHWLTLIYLHISPSMLSPDLTNLDHIPCQTYLKKEFECEIPTVHFEIFYSLVNSTRDWQRGFALFFSKAVYIWKKML